MLAGSVLLPVVRAAAAVAAAAAGKAVADAAVVYTVQDRIPDTAAVLEQRSMLPTVLLALAVATADAAHTLAMPSNKHSAHPQTCLKTAPGTSEYLAAGLQLADLEGVHACAAPD